MKFRIWCRGIIDDIEGDSLEDALDKLGLTEDNLDDWYRLDDGPEKI